ncbi:hypothetical protein H7J50_16040 [Mycobacterium intermedium]|nr:hypothetical protein [Mycobacterium intermedium]
MSASKFRSRETYPASEFLARLVGPHSIDQLVDRYRAVDVNQKCGQDAPLTGMAYFQALPVDSSLDLAEQAEIDRHPSGTLSANRSESSMSGSR